MHVVFVTNKLVNGGGERVLAQLVAGVRQAGGRSTILFLGQHRAILPKIRSEMEQAGAQVILPLAPMAALQALCSATALHLYNVNVYVKALPLLPFFRRAPVICHVHGSAESANNVARRLFRVGWNPCDEIVFVSETGRASWGIERGRVMLNPVSFPPRHSSRPDAFRLGSVNRLVAVKRVAAQLEILAALRDGHGLGATLDIIGEGSGQTALEAKAQSLNLGNVLRFRGGLSHEEVLASYRDYDGFLATSSAEGLGLSLIEALAAGLPAFAARIPAYHEVASIGGGVTFIDPENPTDAAAAIASVLTSATRPAAALAPLAAAFDARRFVAQMLELYR